MGVRLRCTPALVVLLAAAAPARALSPTITHDPVPDGRPAGQAVTLTATVTAPGGVASVSALARNRASQTFSEHALAPVGGALWQGTLPAALVAFPGVQYYLRAVDGSSPALVALFPEAGAAAPLSFDVAPADAAGPDLGHDPPPGPLAEGADVTVRATARDPSGVAAVRLHFRPAGTAAFAGVDLSTPGDDAWEAQVPAFAVEPPGLEYWLEAFDASPAANAATLPEGAPARFLSLPVSATDRSGPLVSHAPLADGQPAGAAATVLATVTDPSGVASVTLSYRRQGTGTWYHVSMAPSGDLWSGVLPAAAVAPPGLQYYLAATDRRSPPNVTLDPPWGATGPHAFAVVSPDAAGPSLALSPVPDGRPEGQAVAVQATATDPSGVRSVTLFHRPAGSGAFLAVAMEAVPDAPFQARIPAPDVRAPAVEYYVEARDGTAAGNAASDPPGGAATPASFTVQPPPDREGPAIDASPVPDGLDPGTDVPVEAVVADPSGVLAVTLLHRARGRPAWTQQPMERDGATGLYRALIPGAGVSGAAVDWYLMATDGAPAANVSVAPPGAPAHPASFALRAAPAPDDRPPTLVHVPPAGPVVEGQPLDLALAALDDSGVVGAVLHLLPPGGTWAAIPMTTAGDGRGWRGTVPGPSVRAGALRYYFEAVDGAGAGNIARDPSGAPVDAHRVEVEAEVLPGGCAAGRAPTPAPWPLLLLLLPALLRPARRPSRRRTPSTRAPRAPGPPLR